MLPCACGLQHSNNSSSSLSALLRKQCAKAADGAATAVITCRISNCLCLNPAGTACSSQPRVELPSARQPTKATDTISPMILSGQSAMSAQDAKDGADKGRQASGQKAGPVHIQCKQAGVEQAAECMVMSGDLGSQVGAVCASICLSVCLPARLF